MISRHFTPSPHLRPYISDFWTIESSGQDNSVFRFAPDGHIELFFSLDGHLQYKFNGGRRIYDNRFGLIGHFDHNADLNISQNRMTFFVKLQAHCLNAICAVKGYELNNAIHSLPKLEELYRDLVDIYHYSRDVNDIVQYVEIWLKSHLNPFSRQGLLGLLCQDLRYNFKTPIVEVLNKYDLSQRRLQQVFKEKVGISPKQFQRLHRFRMVMKAIKENPQKEDFICDLGYHDWSHMSKDMSYFFEISPTDYVDDLFRNGKLINVQRS